jgi:hypothetical protein
MQAALGVGALLVTHDQRRAAAETADAADDRLVLGEQPVAGQGREVLHQARHVVVEPGPVQMAGHLGLLPGAQLGVGLAQLPVQLALQPADFIGDVDVAHVGEMPELLDFTLELGDGLLEIQEVVHGVNLSQQLQRA